MRYINIDKVEPGMILGRPLHDFSACTLLAEGKELSQELIDRLIERGYPGIYVEDELSLGIHIKEVISVQLRNHAVSSLQEMDIDATMDTAKQIVEQILQSDSVALDMVDLRNYDDYIYRHSVNVAILSVVIGIGFAYTSEELMDLCMAAIFHDLGKMVLDPEILNKPGKLTPDEMEIVKRHPRISYEMLYDRLDIPARVKTGVLCHHENEDGSGYPNGYEKDKINPFARIIHVADVYDALSSKRPYKEACSFSEAFEYLLGCCGTLFDKETVEVFSRYVPVYPKGIMVELSNGQEGLVVKNYRECRLRPMVRLLDGSILDLQDESKNRNITILRQSGMNALMAEEITENERGRNQEQKHILVVDDMISSLQVMKGILEEQYKVSLVKSGEQALEFLQKKTPDLILMDVAMPKKNGIQTVREIKEQGSESVPVIFVSALHDIQTVLECRDIQAADYVVKPFEEVYLKERITRVLEENYV